MSHTRNDSLESTASTLISCSSEASVEFYEVRLKLSIDAIRKSATPLQELVDVAEKIIQEKFAPETRSTYKYKKGSDEITVQLDKVIIAMLECAEECGGESGKRYVASAIVSCSKQEDVVGALAALGTTWLTHLLFIFKTSRGRRDQPNRRSSGFYTPTVDKTATHLLEGVGNRKKSFRKDVIMRDGYTCVLTGFQDYSHPKPTEGTFKVGLVGAHILRRAIGEFDNDHTSKSFKSSAIMFDILVNFTHLSVQTLEELDSQLDDPSNGISLQIDAREAFDNHCWCLKRTETQHVYELKIFEDRGVLCKPENNRISFADHSNNFNSSSTRRSRSLDLPNPHFIAIHAAIAGILHMSGAGRFFDVLLDKYRGDAGNIPAVRSWPELETLMEEKLLKESIFAIFAGC